MARREKNIWIKFETKSSRIKGLAFHPKRPWILASLHDGVIQLWDYRMEVMIEKFEEHDGPVRGIHFHNTQQLFVSGGDDYKVKVWNYQRCLFNLLGHLDYIRTVQFHHEHPWILSSSDDQTIRIWNWQSRTCLSVLTGHNHYVMCAQWHPKDDLILSASLDQTVRVWDYTGLRKKSVSGASVADYGNSATTSGPPDLFGASDVVVKHVLEGHSRGVNWAAFHPGIPLIVSGADDREVKLWRMNDAKAWEVDTMRGHVNNVSCVMFHPKKELILSNSEDKSLRVWDMTKQTGHQVFRRDHDRYWILDAHPTQNLLAAGHDSGLLIFKLNRERPALECVGPRLFFYSKLFVYEMDLKKDTAPTAILTTRSASESRRLGTTTTTSSPPRTLSYNYSNQSHHCILLVWDQDSAYELYVFTKGEVGRDTVISPMRGFARSAVFVSRSRFAVLDRQRQLWLRNLKNEPKKKIVIPGNHTINSIFPGGVGRLLLRTQNAIILYDIQALKIMAEFQGQSRHPIKYVSWSYNNKFVAIWSKTHIFILNSKLEEQCSTNEASRIKSGSWDPVGVFIYSTHTHVKYLLPNGDNGIIRTLESPIYITAINANTVYYIDREEKTGKINIDSTEYHFKVALMDNRKKEVMRIMQSHKLVGQSIIAYLQKKGYPELALHFVEDDNIKFSLALECGNIGIALECAKKLDKKECWHKLGVEALRQGNHEVVEAAYQKTKNFERLSFLYLITGNSQKLSKMLHIATLRKDVMGRFHNALYLGNVQERVKVLQEVGQLGLALITAKTHGLVDDVKRIEEELQKQSQPLTIAENKEAKILFPPLPILKHTTWPQLEVRKGFFHDLNMNSEPEPVQVDESKAFQPPPAETEDGDDKEEGDPFEEKEKEETTGGGDEFWGGSGIDLPDIEGDPATKVEETAEGGDDDVYLPSAGKSAVEKWSHNSSLAADVIAAGNFDQAMHLLNRQVGVINFTPLKPYFMAIFNSSHAVLPSIPHCSSSVSPLQRVMEGKEEVSLPALCFKLDQTAAEIKLGYKAFAEGKFKVSMDQFVNILQTLPFIVVDKKIQEQEVQEILNICREYITAIRIEMARREDGVDPLRQSALSAYFTNCKVQTPHLLLGLKVAIKCAYTCNNFKTAGNFCRRVLELCTSNPKANVGGKLVDLKQIKSVLKACEKKDSDTKEIDYDETKVFNICCETFTPIYKGKPESKCPYCQSVYVSSSEGQLCKTCRLSKIGAQASGLRSFPH